MRVNLLILAGTTEATALAGAVAARGMSGIASFAGRVAHPMRLPLPQRVGGFGGADGLAAFLRAARVSHVIDATHPFAARMSRNAVAACARTGVPLIALTRPPWARVAGDDWHRVRDVAGAVAALKRPARRVMLAVGRLHLADFAPNPQHRYLLRLVEPPKGPLPFPDAHVIVARGPFGEAADRALMERHDIQLVVSKNSGGTGAYAKIAAARALGLPVIMIDRPPLPERREVHGMDAVFDWLAHCGADLGV